MKAKDWKKWAKCAGIRAIKTVAQTADRHEISNFHIHAGRNIITANQYYRFAGM